MADAGHEITELLRAWRHGDETALEKLTPRVYRELHRAATRCMRGERDGHTLQTTALINELYLRLTALQGIDWQNRAHFFALCARQMRRILTDEARARQSHKRGGGVEPLSIDAVAIVSPATTIGPPGRERFIRICPTTSGEDRPCTACRRPRLVSHSFKRELRLRTVIGVERFPGWPPSVKTRWRCGNFSPCIRPTGRSRGS